MGLIPISSLTSLKKGFLECVTCGVYRNPSATNDVPFEMAVPSRDSSTHSRGSSLRRFGTQLLRPDAGISLQVLDHSPSFGGNPKTRKNENPADVKHLNGT